MFESNTSNLNCFSRAVTVLIVFASTLAAQAQPFQIATFEIDVTVPIGHALMGGGIAPAKEIIDPLKAQGIILLATPNANRTQQTSSPSKGEDQGGGAVNNGSPEPSLEFQPIVWLSIDWCEIRNDAYDTWREAIAEAVNTTRERVLLAAIHQHDTPVADFTAQQMLDAVGLEKSLCDVPFVKDCIARCAEAARDALENAQPVTHYGVGQAKVEGVASNRRIVAEDGTVSFGRNSSMADPAIREKPIGLIDPNLRTLSFWNNDIPVAAFSTYAVHPMSYYGRGGVSADFIGMARAKMQQETPTIKYLYFSGCSGDVVAGKHNDGTESERPKLAERMYQGMHNAWANTTKHPLKNVTFRTVPLTLPMRETETFTEEAQRHTLNNTSATIFNRNLAAMGLSWRARHDQPIDVCAVDFGQAQFLLMPAESFVEYQLIAQKQRPDSTILVAGYGESAPGYIPSQSAIQENFINTHTWCWVSHEAPHPMQEAIRAALAP